MRFKLKKYLLFFGLILILISCNNNPYNCPIDESVISKNDSIMSLEDYRGGFLRVLSDMDESLLESQPVKSYRLTITYSFEKDIWVYRIEQTKSGGLLTLKKTYKDGYKNYNRISDSTLLKELNQSEWTNIEKIFNANCFWTMPIAIERAVLDGRNCILEGYDPDRENPRKMDYFVVGRWSPERGTDFRRICESIENLGSTN